MILKAALSLSLSLSVIACAAAGDQTKPQPSLAPLHLLQQLEKTEIYQDSDISSVNYSENQIVTCFRG